MASRNRDELRAAKLINLIPFPDVLSAVEGYAASEKRTLSEMAAILLQEALTARRVEENPPVEVINKAKIQAGAEVSKKPKAAKK
jgi:hypothetical protein